MEGNLIGAGFPISIALHLTFQMSPSAGWASKRRWPYIACSSIEAVFNLRAVLCATRLCTTRSSRNSATTTRETHLRNKMTQGFGVYGPRPIFCIRRTATGQTAPVFQVAFGFEFGVPGAILSCSSIVVLIGL